ncbi:cell division control protein 14, SIN component-domain-containing protein [Trametes elegans]|nr:cell division control protein 14, SIN component-domain-containing protein [Trametes elegans]
MHDILQDALDDLVSTRTSTADKSDALEVIEHVVAQTCDPRAEGLSEYFNALQDTFQCNVSSRIIAWTAVATNQLEHCLSKSSADRERRPDVTLLTDQFTRAMALIQGVALTHQPSKQSLGRRYSLEVLLNLLLVSRHLASTSTPSSSTPTSPKYGAPPIPAPKSTEVPLASVMIDTLLCILVDSVPALRVFEELNGVQVVVRILKRAGTPREVRMKCLEFLYFYLLDETAIMPDATDTRPTTPEATPIRAPATAYRSFPSLSANSEGSCTTATSSRSSSASSAFSVSSTSTAAPSRSLHELAVSRNTDPSKSSADSTFQSTSIANNSKSGIIPGLVPSQRIVTPPSGPKAINALGRGQPRSLLMLKREVDYVPLSPKKPELSTLGHRPSSSLRPKLRERTNVGPKLPSLADVLSSEDTEGEEPAQRPTPASTPRARAGAHARGYSVSSTSSLSSTSSFTPADDSTSAASASRPLFMDKDKGKGRETPQTPRPPAKLHRRAQSLADAMSESPLRTPGGADLIGAKLGPRSASSPTAPAAKSGPRTMEEKKAILGSMLGNVDALVEGVRKAGIWGLS